jgi:hypothetical protein
MSADLYNFINTDSPEIVLNILKRKHYSDSISKNRDSEGRFFFRIRDGQMTIGRSANFSSGEKRDVAFGRFVDWVEITLHKNLQRGFEFE